MVKLVLTYDLERYGNSSLGVTHPQNLQDRKYALSGLELILKIHKKYKVSATVFVLGKLLELCKNEVTKLISRYKIDIQQHTYSHILFKEDKNRSKKPASLSDIKYEIKITNDLIKDYLEVDAIGLSTPIGYYGGLKSEKEVLKFLKKEVFKFVKSDSRDIGNKLPGPFMVNGKIKQPYFYNNGIFELTGQGWHDCVIKGLIPHELPPKIANNPIEELLYYLNDLKFAQNNQNQIYSPSFHPWSIAMRDPTEYVIESLIKYSIKNNIVVISAKDFYMNHQC
jgi:peptidoglycan/xylan/chitin deacetylase (PgdA/CDA1 family)